MILSKKSKTSNFPVGNLDILEQELFEYDKALLEALLVDRATGQNIKWGTTDYKKTGDLFAPNMQIMPELVTGKYATVIQPRSAKGREEQERRKLDKGEVFTPSWICNKQNNQIDRAWFGRTRVFNRETGTTWAAVKKKVAFPEIEGHTWQDYVKENRLEITCGEAPYLVSRYDTTTGKIIPIYRRIGILDRKMRIVGENTFNIESWHIWAIEAFKSSYGYDYQGDNVLLARENLLYSYIDYFKDKFGSDPDKDALVEIAEIISWNIWQMDGITMTVPYSQAKRRYEQFDLTAYLDDIEINIKDEPSEALASIIMDWKSGTAIEFRSVAKG